MASTEPTRRVRTAITQMIGRQLACWEPKPSRRIRSRPANPAALATDAMYPVNGVGDPW